MFARLGHRLLAGLAVVLGVVILTFLLLHLAPGDPIDIMLGPTATAEQVAAQRRALGLDRPLPAQFVTWLGRFARGDWGTSIANRHSLVDCVGYAVRGTWLLAGTHAGPHLHLLGAHAARLWRSRTRLGLFARRRVAHRPAAPSRAAARDVDAGRDRRRRPIRARRDARDAERAVHHDGPR